MKLHRIGQGKDKPMPIKTEAQKLKRKREYTREIQKKKRRGIAEGLGILTRLGSISNAKHDDGCGILVESSDS